MSPVFERQNAFLQSVLDHIYVNCVSLVQNVSHSKPIFGDHELVTAELCIIKPVTKLSLHRDWRHYSKEKLNDRLGVVDWSNNAHDVQELWNDFEVKIIRVIDELIPNTEFHDGKLLTALNPIVKHKLNLRNRLLKQMKRRPTLDLKKRIKKLN